MTTAHVANMTIDAAEISLLLTQSYNFQARITHTQQAATDAATLSGLITTLNASVPSATEITGLADAIMTINFTQINAADLFATVQADIAPMTSSWAVVAANISALNLTVDPIWYCQGQMNASINQLASFNTVGQAAGAQEAAANTLRVQASAALATGQAVGATLWPAVSTLNSTMGAVTDLAALTSATLDLTGLLPATVADVHLSQIDDMTTQMTAMNSTATSLLSRIYAKFV